MKVTRFLTPLSLIAFALASIAAQPQENVRVLLDPAGHPFCLCRDDG